MYKEYDDKTLKKLHDVELEIIDEFVRICEKHKLNYSLMAGTLLGAIRHSGFIPWDDDVDVCMMREEYDKFIKIAKEELSDKYYLDCFEYNRDYHLPFAKIRKNNTIFDEEPSHHLKNHKGIYIDIFPLENVNEKGIKMAYFRTFIIKTLVDAILVKYKIRKLKDTRHLVFVIPFLIFGKRCLMRIQNWFITKNKNNKSKYVACEVSSYAFQKEVFLREDFFPTKEIKFEDRKYKVMKEYDKYLSSIYGDYMKLPPKEKRINHVPLKIVFDVKKNK